MSRSHSGTGNQKLFTISKYALFPVLVFSYDAKITRIQFKKKNAPTHTQTIMSVNRATIAEIHHANPIPYNSTCASILP